MSGYFTDVFLFSVIMKALITGASGGIGREIAKVLAERGCELILCSRDENALNALAGELPVTCKVVALDLSVEENCRKLYDATREDGVNILVNNAGFGVFGAFEKTDLEAELDLINLNVRAVHMLSKLFLRDFRKRDGTCYILNVSSMAGFFAGPLFSSYYASKNYVTRLTEGIAEELRRERANVSVSLLCPGPVPTGFGKRAGVSFGLSGTPVRFVADAAVRGMFSRKLYIVPGVSNKLLRFLGAIFTSRFCARIVYCLQSAKNIVAATK